MSRKKQKEVAFVDDEVPHIVQSTSSSMKEPRRLLKYALRNGRDLSDSHLQQLLELLNGTTVDARQRERVISRLRRSRKHVSKQNATRLLKKLVKSSSAPQSASSEDDSSETSRADDLHRNEDELADEAAFESRIEDLASKVEFVNDLQFDKDEDLGLPSESEFDKARRNEKIRRQWIQFRERSARFKFTPVVSSEKNSSIQHQAILGSRAIVVDPNSSPGFVGFPMKKRLTAKAVIVYSTGSSVTAVPLWRDKGVPELDVAIKSHSLDHGIFQLSQLHHPSGSWFAYRGPKQVGFLGLNPQEWQWEDRPAEATLSACEIDTFIRHIEPSPYEPGRVAILSEKKLDIWDVNESLKRRTVCGEFSAKTKYSKCVYGDHPSVIYINSRTRLLLVDERKAKANVLNDFLRTHPNALEDIDSDLMTFGRIPNRRDEYLLFTRSAGLLMDVRAPGKFLLREPHAMGISVDSQVEIEFSKSGRFATVFSTTGRPVSALAGPVPPLPTMNPDIHKDRVMLGLPLDEYHSSGYRLSNALSPYDIVRGLDSPFSFRMLKCIANSRDSIRRMDAPQGSLVKYSPTRFEFDSIIGAGFISGSALRERVVTIGTTYSHLKHAVMSPFLEPHLVCRMNII